MSKLVRMRVVPSFEAMFLATCNPIPAFDPVTIYTALFIVFLFEVFSVTFTGQPVVTEHVVPIHSKERSFRAKASIGPFVK